MPEFTPITDFIDLGLQDEGEMSAGYLAGSQGLPEPVASVYSRAYVHGWRGGAMDSGHLPPDPAYSVLTHLFSLARTCSDQVALDSPPLRMPIQ